MCDCNQDSDFKKCAGKVMIDEEKKRIFCDKFNDKLFREFAKSFFPPAIKTLLAEEFPSLNFNFDLKVAHLIKDHVTEMS